MRKHTALLLLSIAACAHAKSGDETADSINMTLDEVVVTGAAAPKAALSTAPVRVLSQEAMLRSGVTDVSEAIHRMPGVTLRDYGGAGGLKTVSVRGFSAGHTGVHYDGVPVSDVQSGQIDLSRYSIDNVASVGMVIGDNDDIFIPARLAATAARISISTMPVLGRADLQAKMRFGSFGCYNPFLRIGAPIRQGSALNFVGEFVHADNDYPFTLKNGNLVTRHRRANSRMNSGHAELNLLHRFSADKSLSAKAYFYDNSRQLPGPVIYYYEDNHEHLHEQNAMAQGLMRCRLSDIMTLNAIAKWNYSTSQYSDVDGIYPGGRLEQYYWQREYYASAALLCAPASQLLIDYSADYFYNSLNSNLVSNVDPYRNSVLQSLSAKYKSSRFTVMGRVLASLYYNGAKAGDSARNAKKISPSLSLSYQPFGAKLFFVRASYKNIFRMPTFNEAYFDHLGSKDIKPESTDQLNIGSTYTFDCAPALSQASFTVDGYVNNVRDMIVAVPYNAFVWSMTNLGKARSYGVDATADIAFSFTHSHAIYLSLSYSYQRAMPLTNPQSSEWKKQVAYIPRHSGSASLSWENPWANISLSGTGCSHRFTTNNNLPATRVDGYFEIGGAAWRDIPLRRHTLSLRVDVLNLLDKQYCVVARYPMPGRNWKFTITFSY